MVSIVMPVHNTGKYLKESIDSILNQTYKDIELICVDDASDDALTKDILHKYGEEDKRIRLYFLKKNAGAAEARNIGMRMSRGEYIIFLDADDIFDDVMIEKMYECIEENNADICICGNRLFSDIGGEIRIIRPARKEGVTNRAFQLSELPENGLLYWPLAPWNKMLKKSFLMEENIYFQTLDSSNDVFFSCMCSLRANRIIYCQDGKPLLSYRFNNPGQISANRHPICFLKAVKYLLEKQRERICMAEYRQIIYLLMMGAIEEIKVCGREEWKKQCYDEVKKYIRDNVSTLEFDKKSSNYMLQHFTDKEYESGWYENKGNYYEQLKENQRYIFEEIHGKSKIVIWGNGVRGIALQRLFKENGINTVTVTDIKNKNIGKKTQYGYKVVDVQQAALAGNIIVATNEAIYEYLLDRYEMIQIAIMELEKYCPF